MYFDDSYIIDNSAKETNDLKKQKKLRVFSSLLSIFKNIHYIMKDYEDCEEFEDLHTFYSYISQIFYNYLKKYIKGEKIDLKRIKFDLDSTVCKYYFFGYSVDNKIEKKILLLGNGNFEDNKNEFLQIPLPITKTEEWYNDLRNNNL